MKRIDGPMITVKIPKEKVKRLDQIAARHNLKRNEMLRTLLYIGMDAYGAYEKLGVPQLAEIIKRSKRANELEVQPELW